MATTTLYDSVNAPEAGTPIENELAGTGETLTVTVQCYNAAVVSVEYSLNGTDWQELFGTSRDIVWSGDPIRPLSANAKIRARQTNPNPAARARVLAG